MGLFKEVLKRLLSYPQRGQIQVQFDLTRKVFCLSAPIYASHKELPCIIKNYVTSRSKRFFKPHKTSFQIDQKKVVLTQEIPFRLDFQKSLRGQVDEFWKMSRSCHQMLSEIAIEDAYKEAYRLK